MTKKMKGICKDKASVKIRYLRKNNLKQEETYDLHVIVFCRWKKTRVWEEKPAPVCSSQIVFFF